MSAVTTRPVTVHLRDQLGGVIGEAAVALVIGLDPDQPAPGAWAITHQLGSPAGGTHTEVVLADDTATGLPEHLADDLVRKIAGDLYGRAWAFHYRPEQVPEQVLKYGSRVRERVEVTAVKVWT